jgi:DNA processing protein
MLPLLQSAPKLEAERADWLRLARTENVGPITFRQLLRRYGSPTAALAALPDLAARGGKRTLVAPSIASIERELAAHAQCGARLLTLHDADYPARLAALEDAPPVLSVRGQVSLLHKARVIALVGARNASLNGRKLAETLARDLGAAGAVTVSGLARGIDTAVHQASLSTGTVAVLAGGVDNIYPPENAALYATLIEQGCIIAEMPFGSVPRAQHFPRRNRIISGLAEGVVVVEAALQSGSLITARTALEQGREVFAVPGSPLDPRAGGANALLKQGAVLVQTAADVLEHLPQQRTFFEPATPQTLPEPPDATDPAALQPIREQVMDYLGVAPISIDELLRACHCSIGALLTVLLELELAGQAQRLAGHRVCRLYPDAS